MARAGLVARAWPRGAAFAWVPAACGTIALAASSMATPLRARRRLELMLQLVLLLRLPPQSMIDAREAVDGQQTDVGFFWHIADVHVLYGRNVSWAPDRPLPGQPFGSHGADATFASGLYQNLTAEMAQRNPSPDFILLSGDISNEVRDIIEATRILKTHFPRTPVYVSNGNHDVNLGFYNRANTTDKERLGPGTHTRDWNPSLSPDQGDPDLGSSSERLQLLEDVWNATGWLSAPWCEGCLSTFRQAGVYSSPVYGVPRLRILNVNTNPWIGPHLKPAKEAKDPAHMFEYMAAELASARARGEKVLLQGHIPPGFGTRAASSAPDGWDEDANQKVEEILADFADQCVGFFHGHEHSDAIRLHRNGTGNPTVVSYLTPAGAPLNQNPGFRSYTFDKNSLELLDYQQYYLDLDKANAAKSMSWQLEYAAKEYFELESLRPAEWEQLHKRFLVNDTAFQRFAAINYVQYDLNKCTGSCKAVMICGLFAVTTSAHEACVKSLGYASGAQLQRMWLAEGGAVHAALTHRPGAADPTD